MEAAVVNLEEKAAPGLPACSALARTGCMALFPARKLDWHSLPKKASTAEEEQNGGGREALCRGLR